MKAPFPDHSRILSLSLLIALTIGTVGAAATKEQEAWYPCWRGPDGSGASPDSGLRLVGDFSKAKRVWESEERKLPSSYHLVEGGAAGPALADGRLYLNYCVPSPTCIDETYWKEKFAGQDEKGQQGHLGKYLGTKADAFCKIWFKNVEDMRTKCAITAHDVLLCVDARNGTTLWKQVFTDKGVNRSHGRHMGVPAKSGPHAVPCIADGMVFSIGSTGRVYACDAVSGEPRWEHTGLAGHHRNRWEKLKRMQTFGYQPNADDQRFLAEMEKRHDGEKRGNAPEPNNSPAYAQGLVFVNLWGLHALDARTGELRWSGSGAGEKCAPLIWRHEGQAYVIIGNLCYEARSGKLCWETPNTHGSGTPAIADGYLVHTGNGKEFGMVGYRIAPQGFEEAWRLDRANASESHCTPVIYHGRVYSKVASAERGRSQIACFDLATGKELGRTTAFRNDGCGSMLAADGRLYYDGGVLVDAEPTAMRLLGEPPAGFDGDNGICDAASSTPVLYKGLLFMRGQYALYCFDLRQ